MYKIPKYSDGFSNLNNRKEKKERIFDRITEKNQILQNITLKRCKQIIVKEKN